MAKPKQPTTNLDSETGIARWSRRKSAAKSVPKPAPVEQPAAPEPETRAETPELPPLDSLDEHSDWSGFLAPEVDAQLQRRALRKLFHLPVFNTVDGLDDYAEDYRNFVALGDLVTADLKHRLAQKAKQLTAKSESPASPESPNLQAEADAEANPDAESGEESDANPVAG